jgi:competence protein ComEC
MATPARSVLLDTGWRIAIGMLAWLSGIGLQMRQPQLWPAADYLAMMLAALGLAVAWTLLLRGPRGGRAASLPCLCLALALAAYGSTGWRAAERLAQRLPAALEGQDLQLTGVIVGLPQPGPQGTRFVFRVEQAQHDGQPVRVPVRVALGWYRGFDGDALLAAPLQELRAGQRWLLSVRLRQPHGTLNPHGFDLELWMFEQGLRASGTVRATAGAVNRKLADAVGQPLDRARQSVRDAILLRVGDARAAGVLAALAIGDQAAIDREDWDLFRVTGVAHLMSISGLHVTMFAWLAAGLIGALWRLSPRLMLALPAPTAARWGGVLAAAAYALIAGWGVPAQRTLWMLATVALLRTAGILWPAPLVLLAAAALVTLLDPWAVMQPGFWLSFVAVGLLMGSEPVAGRHLAAVAGRARQLVQALQRGLRTQAVASIGLAPLSLVFFQQVSLVGFVANLLAIPLVTLAIVPLALLGILMPPLWALASGLVQALVWVLKALAAWPFGLWTAAAAPAWGVAVGLLGGALLVMPLPWRLRALGLPLLLPLFAPPGLAPAVGEFEVLAADIGQGTAVLLRTRHHLLLYDAGPRYSAEADAAQRVLLPLLRARGEERIDLLMLSHSDIDHVGGAASLLAQLPVATLVTSLPPSHPLRAIGVPHRRCVAGQTWDWDGVRFDVLHPLPGDYQPSAKPNALSCVLRVQAQGGRSLLLTGDIEAAQEAALVDRVGLGLRSQVLLVPHHGSKTSSSEAFIGAVAPGTAVVQAAYRSRFGHPAAQVLARYRALGVELQRSDACGAWSWDAQGVASCQRETAARYWHHRVNNGPGAGP